MKTKTALTGVCAIMLAVALTSCTRPSIEGSWIEPVPGMEQMTQGIEIGSNGVAKSLNMSTLLYEKWQRYGDLLILSGRSIGNHQTLSFCDTLSIQSLTADRLVLKHSNGAITTYQRVRHDISSRK